MEINGYQISSTVHGMRTVYSFGSKVNGQNVVERGLIYGLSDRIADSALYMNSPNSFVRTYAATSNGKLSRSYSDKFGDGSSYAMTMKFAQSSASEFTTGWSIRAYAKLANGTIAYSNVHRYNIFGIADTMYQNNVMNNASGHDYLFNNILKVVNPSYSRVDYNPNGGIVS